MLKSAGINTANIAAASGPSTPSLVTKLAACAIPFVKPPTGTMGNNGAFTSGTALATTYANAYFWFAANQIAAGSAAGWYFGQASSATAITVFNNTYSTGQPTIPSSPTPFVTTGPGATTGVTTAVTGPQISIAAGALGANGALRISDQWSVNSTAGAKTLATAFSGTSIKSMSLTTSNGYRSINTLYNRGVQNAQVGDQFGLTTGGSGLLTGTNEFYAVDFSVAETFQMLMTTAVATDWAVIEAFLLELLPG